MARTCPQTLGGRKITPAQGISMMPVFNGADAATAPRTLYWQHEANAAIREGDWKLVTANDRDAGPWELYNLADDRSESQDLSGRHPQVAKRLREKWTRWAEEVNVLPYPEERGKPQGVPWPPRPWPNQ